MSRRREHEIRNEIQEALSKRPMGYYEISREINASIETVKRHIDHLRSVSVVQKSSFEMRNTEEELWTLAE